MGTVNPVYIIGAGGMGRETLDLYRDAGHEAEVAGFLVEDAYWRPGEVVDGRPVYRWSELAGWPREARLVAAIGSGERGRLVEEAARLGFAFATAVHPSARVSRGARIGEGCIVCAATVVTVQADVGAHTILNVASTISHDTVLGRLVTVSPGVHVAGRVTIGDEVFLGAGAVVIDRVRIGAGTVVGAGSVVTEDLPAKVLAVGVPAKVVRELR